MTCVEIKILRRIRAESIASSSNAPDTLVDFHTVDDAPQIVARYHVAVPEPREVRERDGR